MKTVELMVDELKLQLEDDDLEYGWILGLVKEFQEYPDDQTILSIALEAILKLLQEDYVEIGNPQEFKETWEFVPWKGSLAELKAQIQQVMNEFGTRPRLGDGFWMWKKGDSRLRKKVEWPPRNFSPYWPGYAVITHECTATLDCRSTNHPLWHRKNIFESKPGLE